MRFIDAISMRIQESVITVESKSMTEETFAQAIQSLDQGDQSIDIARRVLVSGEREEDVANSLGLPTHSVSDQVQRIWQRHCATIDLSRP